MTTISQCKHGVTPPTKPQLALALAVVKRKPPGQSVKDYILQVRQFIKKTKELGQVVATDKFFDSVSFWQQAYERSEAAQSKLQDQVHELNQRNEDLLAKLRVKGTTNGNGTLPANKRKALVGKDANSSNMARKRIKLAKSMEKNIPLMDDDDSGEEEDVLCLSRQLYTVQKALQRKANSSSEANSLAIDAVILCKSAEQKLIQTIQSESEMTEQKPSQTEQPNIPDTDAVINGVTVAFHLTHKALHKMTGAENDMQYQGQVVYYLVCLFESTMTALTLHCTAISKQEPTSKNTKSNGGPKSATQLVEQNKRTKENRSPTQNEIASRLADLLCTMALSLNLTRTEDQEVMEGFLFLVLNRMGKMLALHVFHDLRLPMGICPGMSFPDGLEAMTDEGIMPNEAQLEAKYLVRLLDRMLNAGSHQSPPEESATRQFVANAQDRLQKTLLRAVFGPGDRLFREGLRRPHTPPPQVLDSQQIDQGKFSDWLTQELWRLVGWDVLRTVLAPT
ncbi:hypothetical protein E8E15_004506 [Penicillium rubens]|uniref:Uncharacterized protein n=1 Tax=Penicillium chrysogenum TaxID=5076 RepID=A0A167TQD6_PENCH|nr:uncharacterized protein N7525_007236 [Penicillium rubens]KAF3028003.1 hypothetical protein E8E15_004506 [Penicillium rubens]KAJ5049375.1 hypothetical protein NUH16_007893 [Penicillium rubens]KAJ5828983.1 hypothetical protein N7525_007236 [Penicillium rubens]KZN88508.1 hypothetical protein EN45_070830 [Penicillium chrysogenum]